MQFLRINKDQRGIGLLELMLSLAIIAIMLVMATRYFLVTSRSEQINRAFTQINAVVAGVSNWKGSSSDYTGVSVEALAKVGAIASADVSTDQKTLITPWATTGTLAPGTTAASFVITYDGLPSWACESLQQKYAGVTKTSTTTTAVCSKTTFTYTSSGH